MSEKVAQNTENLTFGGAFLINAERIEIQDH